MKRLILLVTVLFLGFSFSPSYGSENFASEKEVQNDTITVGSGEKLIMVITDKGTVENIEVSKDSLQKDEKVIYYLTWIFAIIGLGVVVYGLVLIIRGDSSDPFIQDKYGL